MEYTMSNNGSSYFFELSGSFTFTDNQKFRNILDLAQKDEVRSVTIGLNRVEFIDSAGLGMLLLLRDICSKKTIGLTLQGATGQVDKIFNISKFDQLFQMAK